MSKPKASKQLKDYLRETPDIADIELAKLPKTPKAALKTKIKDVDSKSKVKVKDIDPNSALI